MNDVVVHRYVDCCDLVTRLPPTLYEHVGHLHYIDRLGNVSREPTAQEMREDQNTARSEYDSEGWFSPNVELRDLADHAPVNYVSPLLEAQ